VGLGLSVVIGSAVALHHHRRHSLQSRAADVAGLASAAITGAGLTEPRPRGDIATAIVEDAIVALGNELGAMEVSAPWSAVLELRAFGPKSRPAALRTVLDIWNTPNWETLSREAPPAFRAAPQTAVLSTLLEAGQTLEPSELGRRLQQLPPAGSGDSALALQLELQTLLALRQPAASTAATLAQNAAAAHGRLDVALRQSEPLAWSSWQLAVALLHGPPEPQTERQANTRRLWARLAANPLPADLLSQALRCEALFSTIKSAQVSGAEAHALVTSELEHLRYLVNNDVAAEPQSQRAARSYALRALRLGRSISTSPGAPNPASP
jgi:hypothetical protein